MIIKRSCLIFLLLLCSSIACATPVNITDIRVSHGQTYQMVIDLSGATTFNQFTLHNPRRLVLDISNARKAFTNKPSIYNDMPIKNFRFAQKANGDLRIVYDVTKPCNITATSLRPSGQRGHRILVRLTPTGSKATFVPVPTKARAESLPVKNNPPHTSSKPTKLRDIIIVLDPGHGGKDPGATGPAGTHEKRITLAIALKVRRNLRKIPGIKVYMTRDRDVYPTLSRRLRLSRRVKADLFVSIHADAFKRRSARGATVFALSRGRATSEAARWIAERENKSELLGGVELADKGYMLRSVLVDLSQTATIGLSLKLGNDVVNRISRITKMHSPRVEQASLYVLTSPDIPSILVETGFLSNPHEEQLLNTASHQNKIASSVSNGVERYLIDNPIQGTIFTARMFGGKYIVKDGNSLSGIAAKFNVSVAKLKQINDFKSNQLFTGQVVRIPAK